MATATVAAAAAVVVVVVVVVACGNMSSCDADGEGCGGVSLVHSPPSTASTPNDGFGSCVDVGAEFDGANDKVTGCRRCTKRCKGTWCSNPLLQWQFEKQITHSMRKTHTHTHTHSLTHTRTHTHTHIHTHSHTHTHTHTHTLTHTLTHSQIKSR